MTTSDAPPVPVTTIEGAVAVITMDDGKANVLSHRSIAAINAGLDQAEAEAGAVLITGREGRFCAGFDLAIMAGTDAERVALVKEGGELCMRLYGLGLPVVAACNGHALAAGAIMLMACDTRFGADIDTAKIGMNEVSIGMILPGFAIALAQERLSKRHLTQAAVLAEIYNPRRAVDIGYLDEVVAPENLHQTALQHAEALAGYVRRGALAGTKMALRGDVIDGVIGAMQEDLAGFGITD